DRRLEAVELVAQQVEADDDGVVVGGPVLVRLVERLLGRRLEGRVVVEDGGLVGVDVPVGGAGHLAAERRAGEGVVEVAALTIEHVGMGEPALTASTESSIAYELRSPRIR